MEFSFPYEKYTPLPTGEIISKQTGKPLRFTVGKDGYCRVGIYNGKKHASRMYVHRIIAQALIPNPENLKEVNHLDGNKTNNSVENLEWCGRAYNMVHAYASGLKTGPHLGKLGHLNHNSKPVRGIHQVTGEVVVFPGASEAARNIGKHKSSVLNVLGGRRKTSGGYSWEYVE